MFHPGSSGSARGWCLTAGSSCVAGSAQRFRVNIDIFVNVYSKQMAVFAFTYLFDHWMKTALWDPSLTQSTVPDVDTHDHEEDGQMT